MRCAETIDEGSTDGGADLPTSAGRPTGARGARRLMICSLVLVVLLGAFFAPRMRSPFYMAKLDLLRISDEVMQYTGENNGRIPESLQELFIKQRGFVNWESQTESYRDPWGNLYEYERLPDIEGGRTYLIWTRGSDGAVGGEGTAKDLSDQMVEEGDA